jgi:hypothetical protein
MMEDWKGERKEDMTWRAAIRRLFHDMDLGVWLLAAKLRLKRA